MTDESNAGTVLDVDGHAIYLDGGRKVFVGTVMDNDHRCIAVHTTSREGVEKHFILSLEAAMALNALLEKELYVNEEKPLVVDSDARKAC